MNLIPKTYKRVYYSIMVENLNTSLYNRQSALADLLAKRASTKSSSSSTTQSTSKSTDINSTSYKPKGREIHDTVEISGGKIVNLARGYDLAAEVRNEKDPAKVRQMIADGQTDIKRIGKLFQETFVTLKSLFASR